MDYLVGRFDNDFDASKRCVFEVLTFMNAIELKVGTAEMILHLQIQPLKTISSGNILVKTKIVPKCQEAVFSIRSWAMRMKKFTRIQTQW